MSAVNRILVTGAGGFIGHDLVKRLKADGHWVRGADIKRPEYEASAADEFEVLDLRQYDSCFLATRGGVDRVYNLAADIGASATSGFSCRYQPEQHSDRCPEARGQPPESGLAFSVFVLRMRVCASEANVCRCRASA